MPKGDKYKLKADPDDGTTHVANLLMEAAAMASISGLEKGAVFYLMRRTYGWSNNKGQRLKERQIGLTEWARGLGTGRAQASKALKALVDYKIIIRKREGMSFSYSINTYINQWNSNCIDLELLSYGNCCQMDTVAKSLTEVLPNGNRSVHQMATPLDTNLGVVKKDKERKKEDGIKVSLEQYLEQLRPRYSTLDIDAEWEKCKLWWEESGKVMKRPKLALRNWLDKARKMFEQSGAEQPVKTIADYNKEEEDAG